MLSKSEEQALLIAAQSNSPAAVTARVQLIEAFEPLLTSLVNQLLCDHPLADELREDALQEARAAFLAGLCSFSPKRGASLGTFAKVVVRRKLISWLRKQQSYQQRIAVYMSKVQVAGSGPNWLKSDEQLDLIENADWAADVRSFVRTLPSTDQQLIIGVHWDRQKQARVAAALGMSRMQATRRLCTIYAFGRQALVHLAPDGTQG